MIMKNIFGLLLLATIGLTSCNNNKTTPANKTSDNNLMPDLKSEFTKVNELLKQYEEPSQIFKVTADKPMKVRGKQGTIISINPADLVTENGQPMGKNIEVELKELINQEQLLRTNAQTTSNGQLLVSGGAYFIGLASNGVNLKLKEDKTLNVQFPKLSEKEMTLFYGKRNDLEQMNWQKTTDIFKMSQQPLSARPYTDTASSISSEYTEKETDIDALLDYVEGKDTSTTPEGRERKIKQRKDYIVSQKVYDEIGLRQLGWINCDRFLEVENKTDFYANFNPQDSVKNANVYLVFKDINSVIQACYYSDKSPQFENMPIGYKARLIAYTVKDEKVFAYSNDLTITKGQKLILNLKEIDEKDFKKLISN